MKKRPSGAGAARNLDLPEEPPLRPEEAAEAMREARRIHGRPAPEPAAPQETDTEPEPPVPWGPMRPDEVPS